MTGRDLVEWRRRNGFTQAQLMRELGVRSRQTIISWEKADTVDRVVQLALIALETDPGLRLTAGKRATAREEREYFTRTSR